MLDEEREGGREGGRAKKEKMNSAKPGARGGRCRMPIPSERAGDRGGLNSEDSNRICNSVGLRKTLLCEHMYKRILNLILTTQIAWI